MKRYLVDTCVWRDFMEERKGPRGRPIGKHAGKFFLSLLAKGDSILFSRMILTELKKAYSEADINTFFGIFSARGQLQFIKANGEEWREARRIAIERDLPVGDSLHAIQARNNDAIVITQDKHFNALADVVDVRRPEEVFRTYDRTQR